MVGVCHHPLRTETERTIDTLSVIIHGGMGVVWVPFICRRTVELRGTHAILRHYLDEGVWWRIADGDGQRLTVI